MKLFPLLLGYLWASGAGVTPESQDWLSPLQKNGRLRKDREPAGPLLWVSVFPALSEWRCVCACVCLAFALPTFPDFTRQIPGSCARRLCRPSRPIPISGSHGERRTQDAQGVKK